MRTEIKLLPNETVESVVYTLFAARARKENAYCIFENAKICTDKLPTDLQAAYLYIQGKLNPFGKEVEKAITEQKVVWALSFISTHLTWSQEKIAAELLRNGIDFNNSDIMDEFPEANDLNEREGMAQGNLAWGARIVIQMRDATNTAERAYWIDHFFSNDSEQSVYHFLRMKGRKEFNKKYCDELNAYYDELESFKQETANSEKVNYGK